MFAGPMQRQANGFSSASGIVPSGAVGAATAAVTGADLRASIRACNSAICFCKPSSCFLRSASVRAGTGWSPERTEGVGARPSAATRPPSSGQRRRADERITGRTLGKRRDAERPQPSARLRYI